MRKMIHWGTPKYYQKGYEEREDQPIPAKLPKPRSKYCKRLKGPHKYGEWKQCINSFSNKPSVGFYERRCVACNRKDTWIAPDLPGPYWKLDPDARPPIDK